MKVSLQVVRERRAKCLACEFSRQFQGRLRGCNVCGCGLMDQIKDPKGRCYLGRAEFPLYQHMQPRWGPQ